MADINVFITSDLTQSERRVSPLWDLAFFKRRLEQITGIAPQHQTILVYPSQTSNEHTVVSDSQNYSAEADTRVTVGDLVAPYCRVHVKDDDRELVLHHLEAGEDYGFSLSEEEYARRNDSVLQWKKQQQLGRFDPRFDEIKARNLAENAAVAARVHVGDRCRVINIEGERRGTVRFVGAVPAIDQGEQTWVGIEFDEPVGKHDGSVGGTRVFACRRNHGSFVKPKQVEVGDFPEETYSDDEM
jgi:tubulin-folding cofactor B